MKQKQLFTRINIFAKRFKLEKYFAEKKINFREVYSENGKQLQLEICPFCKSLNYKGNYHPYRFYIRSDDKRYFCYNCSEKGSILKILSIYEHLSQKDVIDKYIFGDYVELLPDELKILIQESGTEKVEENKMPPMSLPPSFEPIVIGGSLSEEHRYLSSRGLLNQEMISKYDLRYCQNMKRIIFPVIFEGYYRGWQGRDITNTQEPKYLINKGFRKQTIIYNYDQIKDAEFITINEGPIDAIKCHKIFGTCLFGKYLSDIQQNYLLSMPNLKRVYLCLDDDPDAKKSQQALAEKLSCFFEVYEIKLPSGKDAGDMTPDQMVIYMQQASKFTGEKLKVLK